MPKASVVLTNPTRYAIALIYDLSQAEAPFVVAKGQAMMWRCTSEKFAAARG
ncbi:EscU/YscU/HrcU family type III secretion system export apparatus switch protein [Vibrio chagasii]|nr:EscU/YscU/HrcU family type III secretion system export apparatus switch protein [Vibrio chagasii]